jgi:putative methionine-R-sulfoxide reductase with GAF domain
MPLTDVQFRQTAPKARDFSPVDLGSALNIVVQAAMLKTNATGVAVALMERGRLLCRARVGEIAPDLGVALNLNSGITGACVRTGQPLNCLDAHTDRRVDTAVCRASGIRSIVVIPILADGRVVGILEALSGNAHAFEPEHVQWLKRLADFARDLCHRTNRNAGPELVQKASQPQPKSTLASNSRLQPVNGAVQQPSIDKEPPEHDPELAAFLGVLEKMPPQSTWEDICQQLISGSEK